MSDEPFKGEINKYNILFLCETWLPTENINNLRYSNGYLWNFVFRNKRRKRRLSIWGESLVYFRNELNKVVSVFDKSNENILWIKIGKNLLNNKSKTYIACVYNSPENSTYTNENEYNVLQLIEEQLAKFSKSDHIVIGEDLNSKISTKADFIVEDRKDLDFLSEGYELDTFTTHRHNEDVSLNSYGEKLIQLCIPSKLRVLNSRTRGDLQGHFTYLGYQGCSTVDLVLASQNIFQTNLIQYLPVQTFTTFSYHRSILLQISRKYPARITEIKTSNCTLEDKP